MFKRHKATARRRPLSFPNPSRSYDETRSGIHFWGYDRTIEIAFFIEPGALSQVNPRTKTTETCALATFDDNRDQICAVAGNIYQRRHEAHEMHSYVLSESDFSGSTTDSTSAMSRCWRRLNRKR